MKLTVLDIEKISQYLIPVTNPNFFEYRKFPRESLFSLEIFGPMSSYKCACYKNSFKGPNYTKRICPKCNVEIISSSYREKRFSYIKFPFKLFNPLFLHLFSSKSNISKFLNKILFEEKDFEQREGEKISDTIERIIRDYIKELIDKNVLKPEIKEFVLKNWDNLFIDKILVIPPDYRPCVELSNKLFVVDEINSFYSNMLRIINHINNLIISVDTSKDLFLYNFRYLEKNLIELFNFVISKLSGKSGLIRFNILGKRVDFSGRGVIVPDPTLTLRECGLSYNMVLEIVKPAFLKYLVNKRVSDRSNEVLRMIDESIENNDFRFFNELSDFTKNMYCVLNRQPSLHRMSMLSFRIKIHKENVIKIHPLVCNPYNADFDGDAMALYIPISEESQIDIKEHLSIDNNLVSPSNLESICKPSQDIILGIYELTKNDNPKNKEYKGKLISEGRYLFNSCLPGDYPIIDEPINKKVLYRIFDEINFIYPSNICIESMDKIKELGFRISTEKGFTISISDVYRPEIFELRTKLKGKIDKDLDYIKNNKLLNKRISKVPINIFIESGARGSIEQERQLIFSRGYVADSFNKVRKNLIKNSFASGLEPHEFFESCYGTRKGLLDTALSAGDSGYLTRQLTYSTCFIELHPELEDCGSTDLLYINVKDKNMALALVGRYYFDEDKKKIRSITPSNCNSFVGKTIGIRSPIYCKSEKICRTCYGKFYKVLHSRQIGIIATQAVGERATQLVLRTFHISGAVQSTRTDEKNTEQNQDIISGMHMAKTIFHNPYNLFIANEIKKESGNIDKKRLKEIKNNMSTNPNLLVELLYSVFSKFGRINIVHFEIIVSSMMWSGDKIWRLLENRSEEKYQYESILKIPSKVSWLLGMAFSHVNKGLVNGILDKGYKEDTSITELFKY